MCLNAITGNSFPQSIAFLIVKSYFTNGFQIFFIPDHLYAYAMDVVQVKKPGYRAGCRLDVK
jgi:hypothetical protein